MVQRAVGERTGRYVAWFVHNSWWLVNMEGDEAVFVPDEPPEWPKPCPN